MDRHQPASRTRTHGVLVGGVVATLAAVTVGTSALAASTSMATPDKAPRGYPGSLLAVTTVPHSADLWALGETSTAGNTKFFLLHLHHGRWTKVTPPKLGGRYGTLTSMTAASTHAVYVAGGRQVDGIQNIPSIYRSTGGQFARTKTPEYCSGASDVETMAESSTSNVWAAGDMWPCPADSGQAMLHWNGKTWSSVAFPQYNNEGISSISTSSGHNAWALVGQQVVIRWDGQQWTQVETAPANVNFIAVATSGGDNTYVIGNNDNPSTGVVHPVIMRFNGKQFVTEKLPPGSGNTQLYGVSIHGDSVWATGSKRNPSKDTNRPLILHSSGGAWKIIATPSLGTNTDLQQITAASTTRAYAVGYIENTTQDTASTLVVQLSGSSARAIASRS